MNQMIAIVSSILISSASFAQSQQWTAVPEAQTQGFRQAVSETIPSKTFNCSVVKGGTIYGESGESTVNQILVNFVNRSPQVFKSYNGSQPLLLFSKVDAGVKQDLGEGRSTQTTNRRDTQITTTSDRKTIASILVTKSVIKTDVTMVNVGDLENPNYQLRTSVSSQVDQAICVVK